MIAPRTQTPNPDFLSQTEFGERMNGQWEWSALDIDIYK